jgi:hypothetical protein
MEGGGGLRQGEDVALFGEFRDDRRMLIPETIGLMPLPAP